MPMCCFLAYLFECISTNSTDHDGWQVKTANGASVGHMMGRWGGGCCCEAVTAPRAHFGWVAGRHICAVGSRAAGASTDLNNKQTKHPVPAFEDIWAAWLSTTYVSAVHVSAPAYGCESGSARAIRHKQRAFQAVLRVAYLSAIAWK